MIGRICAAFGFLALGLALPIFAHAQSLTARTATPVQSVSVELGRIKRGSSATRFDAQIVISQASPTLEEAIKRAISVRSSTKQQYWLGVSAMAVNGTHVVIDGRVRLERWASRKVLGKTLRTKLGDETHTVGYWLQPAISRGEFTIVSKRTDAPGQIDTSRSVTWTPSVGIFDKTLASQLQPKVFQVKRAQALGGTVKFDIALEVDNKRLQLVAMNRSISHKALLKELLR